MNRLLRSSIWTLALVDLAACSAEPARIDLAPVVPVYDRALLTLDARALDAGGEALDVPVRAVAVSDGDVMLLGKNGELQCVKYGDATVTLEAGEPDGAKVRADTLVRCQLIKEITVEPKTVSFTLKPDDAGVVRPSTSDLLTVSVIALDGSFIEGAEVSITSQDPTIARVDKGAVQVRQRGATVINVSAGNKVVEVPVEASLVVTDRRGLTIEDGHTHGIPVQAGRYRVTVGSDQPVELKFQGADCEGDGEQTAHTVTCELQQAGNLRIANPAILGLGGGTATIFLRVLQLP